MHLGKGRGKGYSVKYTGSVCNVSVSICAMTTWLEPSILVKFFYNIYIYIYDSGVVPNKHRLR